MLAAFKKGYSAHRAWPLESEEQLQTLIAARMVMFVNYVAHALDEADAKEYLDGWFRELGVYWEEYK